MVFGASTGCRCTAVVRALVSEGFPGVWPRVRIRGHLYLHPPATTRLPSAGAKVPSRSAAARTSTRCPTSPAAAVLEDVRRDVRAGDGRANSAAA